MREQVKPAPFITCRWARHSMPTCLIGNAGRGVHHGQKRKLQHRPNTLPQTIFSFIRTFRLQSGGGPYIAQRVCRRDGLPRRLEMICGRGPQLVWGQESAPLARSGSWKGERASEGRQCSERGTLNEDRETKHKGSYLLNGHLRQRVSAAESSVRCVHRFHTRARRCFWER
jgi:hypothetical protein